MNNLKNNNIKDLLKQYNDLVKEKQEIQAAIDKIQRELDKMEAEGYTEKQTICFQKSKGTRYERWGNVRLF